MKVTQKVVREILEEYFPYWSDDIMLYPSDTSKGEWFACSRELKWDVMFFPKNSTASKVSVIGAIFHEMSHLHLKHGGKEIPKKVETNKKAKLLWVKSLAKQEADAEKTAFELAIENDLLGVANYLLVLFVRWGKPEFSAKSKKFINDQYRPYGVTDMPDFYAMASRNNLKWMKKQFIRLRKLKELRKTTKMSQKSRKRQKISGV